MKNRKSLISLFSIFGILLVGITIAYFTNIIDIENIFKTKQYGTTVTEKFISPDNWLPGQTTEKIVYAENTGEIDEAIRISFTETWISADGEELSGLINSNGYETDDTNNGERAAILNLANTEDWVKEGDYYYYKYKISPGELTGSFLKSVTFNKKTNESFSCSNLQNEGITQYVDCDSTENSYADATYKLSLKIESIQYDKYKEAWNTNVEIINNKKFLKGLPVNVDVAKLTSNNKDDLFTFHHETTEQTPALTDYRYIGEDPDNYVYFNCADEKNLDTCEVWRIVGVFDVDDGTGNYEGRIKLISGEILSDLKKWDDKDYDFASNDWTQATLNQYLNEDYFTALSESSQDMIANSKYYLGDITYNYNHYSGNSSFGTVEELYNSERGREVFNPYTANSWECNNTATETGRCALRSISWEGKVALLYPSDNFYTYSHEIDNICFNDIILCDKLHGANPNMSWIYNSGILNNQQQINGIYLLNPNGSSRNVYALQNNYYGLANWSSTVTSLLVNYAVDANHGIRPVVYLKSDAHVISGTGKESDPYILSLSQEEVPTYNSKKEYKNYNIGDNIIFDNNMYYVIKSSNESKDYVVLLKAIPLTSDEINLYSSNYVSENGEYPYLENENCNNNNRSACSTNYVSSDIKTIIDGWAQKYNDVLVIKNEYKAKLLDRNTLIDNFGYEIEYSSPNNFYRAGEDTPSWIYIEDKPYWTMTQYNDYGNQIYGVKSTLSQEQVYNKIYIRPVINLKKCAIDNTCE